VINFDVPYDSESYVHRIGRTGRAGRSGEAILFIAPRERNMLRIIERATRQPIEAMTLPTAHDVNRRRVEKFKSRLTAALATPPHEVFRSVVEEYTRETGTDLVSVAAALASLAQGESSLVLGERAAERPSTTAFERATHPAKAGRSDHSERPSRPGRQERPGRAAETSDGPPRRGRRGQQEVQITYRLEVGRRHGVQPGNIVGALAHEADLAGSQINRIDIHDEHTFVNLPPLSPKLIAKLRRMRISGQRLDISRADGRVDQDD
jgi:ATP-dependent RNA helicase DeaD